MGLLDKLRHKRQLEFEKKRNNIIFRSMLSEREFYLLETAIELWNELDDLMSIPDSELLKSLRGNPRWESKKEILKDMRHLRSRGFLYYEEGKFQPTSTAADVYCKTNPKERFLRDACWLPKVLGGQYVITPNF